MQRAAAMWWDRNSLRATEKQKAKNEYYTQHLGQAWHY